LLADTTSDALLSVGSTRIPGEQAKVLFARFAEVITSRDAFMFALGDGEGCVVRFNSVALFGCNALQRFKASCIVPVPKSFLREKPLWMVCDDHPGVEWVNCRVAPETSTAMKSGDFEFVTMRDDRIAHWDVATAVWSDER
jgi:hypothetical protein